MTVRTNHDTFDKTWFITFTCYKWLPLFELTHSYDLVYNWLNLIRDKQQAETLAFVIMPNHLHLLLRLNGGNVNLNILISNAKRFMAYEIVKRLKSQQRHPFLLWPQARLASKKDTAESPPERQKKPPTVTSVAFDHS